MLLVPYRSAQALSRAEPGSIADLDRRDCLTPLRRVVGNAEVIGATAQHTHYFWVARITSMMLSRSKLSLRLLTIVEVRRRRFSN